MTRRLARNLTLVCCALVAPLARGQGVVACNLTVPDVQFGVYNTLATTAAQVSGSMVIDCYLTAGPASQQIDYALKLSTGGALGYNPRKMTKTTTPVESLNYNLYLNSVAAGSIWGDGTGGSTFPSGKITVNKTPGGNIRTFTLIGQIPALQAVGEGLYRDSIVLTATWN